MRQHGKTKEITRPFSRRNVEAGLRSDYARLLEMRLQSQFDGLHSPESMASRMTSDDV